MKYLNKDIEIVKILNYLKGSKKSRLFNEGLAPSICKAGLTATIPIINFGCATELEWKRIIL